MQFSSTLRVIIISEKRGINRSHMTSHIFFTLNTRGDAWRKPTLLVRFKQLCFKNKETYKIYKIFLFFNLPAPSF